MCVCVCVCVCVCMRLESLGKRELYVRQLRGIALLFSVCVCVFMYVCVYVRMYVVRMFV